MEEKIIDKLQKLIAHAESAKAVGNMAEAEAFAGKVQELLTKHQLSMSDIEIREEKEAGEEVDRQYVMPEEVGVKRSTRVVRWQVSLLKGIAAANSCEAFYHPGTTIQSLVGLTADRLQCIALFRYFVGLAADLCDIAAKDHKLTEEYIDRAGRAAEYDWTGQGGTGEMAAYMRQWRMSWLTGFVRSISVRLYNAKEKAVEEAESSTALVHFRDKEAMVKAFVGGMKIREVKREEDHNHGAYHEGRKAGESVALTSNSLTA